LILDVAQLIAIGQGRCEQPVSEAA
jgi:hypothetical protein